MVTVTVTVTVTYTVIIPMYEDIIRARRRCASPAHLCWLVESFNELLEHPIVQIAQAFRAILEYNGDTMDAVLFG